MNGMKTYNVVEIFYSLQGEGFWTGAPAVFIRFSGCNLRCPFCDTDFSGGESLSAAGIVSRVKEVSEDCRRIIVTGGEPSLQFGEELVNAFHEEGYKIHIETNGTRPLPPGIDWITLSPKMDWQDGAEVVIGKADELKLVYTGQDVSRWESFPSRHFFLQPCSMKNTDEVVNLVLARPRWRLSLQTHKYLDIR